jgi:hypothetical protein
MADNELELIVKLTDQLSPKLKEVMNTLKAAADNRTNQQLENRWGALGKAANAIGSSFKDNVIPIMARFGAAAAAVSGAVYASVKAMEQLDEKATRTMSLDSLSKRTKIAVHDIQRLEATASAFGTSSGEVAEGLKRWNDLMTSIHGGVGGRTVAEALALREALFNDPSGKGREMWAKLDEFTSKFPNDRIGALRMWAEEIKKIPPELRKRVEDPTGLPRGFLKPEFFGIFDRLRQQPMSPEVLAQLKKNAEAFKEALVNVNHEWNNMGDAVERYAIPPATLYLNIVSKILGIVNQIPDAISKIVFSEQAKQIAAQVEEILFGPFRNFAKEIADIFGSETWAEAAAKAISRIAGGGKKKEAPSTDSVPEATQAPAPVPTGTPTQAPPAVPAPAGVPAPAAVPAPTGVPTQQGVPAPAAVPALPSPTIVPAPDAAVEEDDDVNTPGRMRRRDAALRRAFVIGQQSDIVLREQSHTARAAGMSLRDYAIGGLDPQMRHSLVIAGMKMAEEGLQLGITQGFRVPTADERASGVPDESFGRGTRAVVSPPAAQWLERHPEYGLTPSGREPGAITMDKLSDVLRAERLSREIAPRSDTPAKVEGDATLTVNVDAPRGTRVGLRARGMFKKTLMTRSTQMNLAPIDGDDNFEEE